MERRFLKIAFLLRSDGVSGGVRAIVRFANELLKMGHHVRIFYRDDKSIIRNIYQRIRYGRRRNWLDDFNGKSFAYRHLQSRSFSQDELIVAMCAQTTFDACSLSGNVGIKLLHCHGAELENWEYMVKSWRLKIPKIVVSSFLIDLIKSETGQEVIGIAPDGVDMSEYYSCIEYDKRRAIGGVIRWGLAKDPDSTIKVFQQLHELIPDADLVTFGADRNANVNHVAFTRNPTVPQAREIYSSCKIWFLASKQEGFGLPLLEAMACGCVVVSTNCGGPSDIIADGINGFIVDVGDVDMMVDKIKAVWEDAELQQQISKRAIETARDFTWRAGAKKLEGFLQDIYKNDVLQNK